MTLKTFTYIESRPDFSALFGTPKPLWASPDRFGNMCYETIVIPSDEAVIPKYDICSINSERVLPRVVSITPDVAGSRDISGPVFEGQHYTMVRLVTQLFSPLEMSLLEGNVRVSMSVDYCIYGGAGNSVTGNDVGSAWATFEISGPRYSGPTTGWGSHWTASKEYPANQVGGRWVSGSLDYSHDIEVADWKRFAQSYEMRAYRPVVIIQAGQFIQFLRLQFAADRI